MTEYVSAPSISEKQMAKMKELISLYVERRDILFSKPLQPKHHYLLHYFELIYYFGALICLWTNRFESRHQFFKKAAKAANNFKNITNTLARKYVLNFAYKFTGLLFPPGVTFNEKDAVVPGLNSLKPEVDRLISLDPSFNRTFSSVSVHGIAYNTGFWIILGCEIKDLIVGEIVMILM